ncbi:MAG TPA: hypothetical protein VE990_04435 [Acidimicrobiales bacterium]|nr:hypothetical protein [Acidimicrobiales bacterium]
MHDLAIAMPDVAVTYGPAGNPIYRVGSRSFIFFRTRHDHGIGRGPDVVDPKTGERYNDLIVFSVQSEHAKQALIADPAVPFFSTPHFNGHLSVLIRGSRIGELSYQELSEVIEEAWLSRASASRRREWLARSEASTRTAARARRG